MVLIFLWVMKAERPCSPCHFLSMLNENMKTDMLGKIHQGVYFEKQQHADQNPLENTDNNLVELMMRNSFNTGENNPFDSNGD